MADGSILALDAATVTGYCHGAPGGPIYFGAIRPAPRGAPDGDTFIAYAKWLRDMVGATSPVAIYLESPLDPRRVGPGTNAATFRRLITLAGIVKMIAAGRGQIPVTEVDAATVRRFFIGENCKRERAKRLTIARCVDLGHEPQDDNAADAIALHYYASHFITKKSISDVRQHELAPFPRSDARPQAPRSIARARMGRSLD